MSSCSTGNERYRQKEDEDEDEQQEQEALKCLHLGYNDKVK